MVCRRWGYKEAVMATVPYIQVVSPVPQLLQHYVFHMHWVLV